MHISSLSGEGKQTAKAWGTEETGGGEIGGEGEGAGQVGEEGEVRTHRNAHVVEEMGLGEIIFWTCHILGVQGGKDAQEALSL